MNILKNMAFKQFGKQSNKFEQELVKNLSETGPMKFAAKKTYEFVSGTKLPETSYEQCPTRYNPQDPRTFHLYVLNSSHVAKTVEGLVRSLFYAVYVSSFLQFNSSSP